MSQNSATNGGRAGEMPMPTDHNSPSLLKQAARTSLPALHGKPTAECMIDEEMYSFRQPEINFLLPKQQPASAPTHVSAGLVVGEVLHFADMFRAQLGLSKDESHETLVSELKERGCVLTLPQVELLAEKQFKLMHGQSGGEDVGLQMNCKANFFPVFDSGGGVSVLRLCLEGRRIQAVVNRFDYGFLWQDGVGVFTGSTAMSRT